VARSPFIVVFQSRFFAVELSVYEAEHENELSHWWFVERRRMIGRILGKLDIGYSSRILDVGTSTGTNLRLLKELGFVNVVGVEPDSQAGQFARIKTGIEVLVADCTSLPFGSAEFDCVLATDVLEHIEDDEKAVQEIVRVLRPGGHLVVTVPAFMALWGIQDDLSHHKRRYRKERISNLLSAQGLVVHHSWYFNFILFPAIFVARKILKRTNAQLRSEGDINTRSLNLVLGVLFRLDCFLAPVLRVPFGVSVCLVSSREVP
jgi:SAM-dependent methyltransferase